MVKGRSLLIGAKISAVIIILLLLIGNMGTFEVAAMSETPAQTLSFSGRPDAITIDTLKNLKELERTPVVFFHDRHTIALEKKNKDCTNCHLSENDRMSPMFMRHEDSNQETVMNIYHNNCIGCHSKMLKADEKTGPIVCGECHRKKYMVISSRAPMGFDRSLHYRHYLAQKEKCEACHHEYDQENKKLVYAEGKEGTCRYCHKKNTEEINNEKRISMRLASHLSCIDCHMKTTAKNMFAGPVTCGGCHDLEAQKNIEKLDKVPRIKRKQPDIVLIKTGDQKDLEPTMYRVPFGHKAHEGYNDTCRVCHHADLHSCIGCPTLKGSEEGKYIKLNEAMHLLGTKQSCMGCHETNLNNKACAGCHAFMEKGRKQDEAACMKCHMAPPKKSAGVLYQSGERRLARMIPEIWQSIFGNTSQDMDIPKKVVIRALENEFEPVELEHLKIINYLKKHIDDSKLASYFHPVEASLCQGCHHNSPASATPPKCGSCHGKPFNEKNLAMPGLKGAYHRQCMGCHDQMGIEKPDKLDCAGCHIEKKQQIKEGSPDKTASQAENKPTKIKG
ncbi:MAG: cytochrome c3 family protein [Desulfobacterales bacterium]|nr:MAG: cytochrome c3 family protein [Desulfobacterales bacterium]